MRAVYLPEFGAPPVVGDLPSPVPASDQLSVTVLASSLNAADWKLAFGAFPEAPRQTYPVVLGRDFAGSVNAVGSDVGDFAVGDEVFGFVPDRPLVRGAFAQKLVVAAGAVAPKPDTLPTGIAGTLGVAGTTALTAVAAAEIQRDDQVLVVGATGGVGVIVVQLAVAAGAAVAAPAWQEDAELLTALGVGTVLDRDQPLGSHEGGYDCLIDLTSGGDVFDSRLGLVRHGGRAVSSLHARSAGPIAASHNITVRSANGSADPQLFAELGSAVIDDVIDVHVTRTIALAEIPEALIEHRDTHVKGKSSVVP